MSEIKSLGLQKLATATVVGFHVLFPLLMLLLVMVVVVHVVATI
jgi:hypothetical protein